MKTNVGGIDKILRIAVGIALIAMAYMNVVGVWGYIGVVPLLTGLIGWCPVYPMFGISSCPMKKSS
jgi:hypothetical protein